MQLEFSLYTYLLVTILFLLLYSVFPSTTSDSFSKWTIAQFLPSSCDPLNVYHLHSTLNIKTTHFSIDMFMQLCP